MENPIARSLNYLWHSIVAPNLYFEYGGGNVFLNRFRHVENIVAADAIKLLKDKSSIKDLSEISLKRAQGQSMCSIQDDSEERKPKKLADLVELGRVSADSALLLITQENPNGLKSQFICFGTTDDLKEKMKAVQTKVAEYDSRYPVWVEQKRHEPSLKARAFIHS